MALYRNVGSKKTLTCTLATPTWTVDGSTIPATDSTRWGRTLQASDFPTWSFSPASEKYIGKVVVSIYNNSGSSQSVGWKIYKNGSTVNTGTRNVSNGNYCVFNGSFYGVNTTDTIEISIWTANNTNVTVQGSLIHVVPTRLLPTSKTCIEVSYTFGNYTYPSPLSMIITNSREYIGSNITSSNPTSKTFSGLSFISQNNYGLFQYGAGDYSYSDSANNNANATLQYIDYSQYPTVVSFREVRRGV
jgi:hypothetical protein